MNLPACRRRQQVTGSWRQQEITRLHALPVSARIAIVPPGDSASPSSPSVISRGSFENEVAFAVSPSFVCQNAWSQSARTELTAGSFTVNPRAGRLSRATEPCALR